LKSCKGKGVTILKRRKNDANAIRIKKILTLFFLYIFFSFPNLQRRKIERKKKNVNGKSRVAILELEIICGEK
jgi:hypothetical protein